MRELAAIEVEIADELFVAKGLMIKERNYLEIYRYENWTDKSIPVFVKDEAFRPTELTMTSGRTQVRVLPSMFQARLPTTWC